MVPLVRLYRDDQPVRTDFLRQGNGERSYMGTDIKNGVARIDKMRKKCELTSRVRAV